MSEIVPFLPKEKAKAELGKLLAKGKTKAKDAKGRGLIGKEDALVRLAVSHRATTR